MTKSLSARNLTTKSLPPLPKPIKVDSAAKLERFIAKDLDDDIEIIITDHNFESIKKVLSRIHSIRKIISVNTHISSFGSVANGVTILKHITARRGKIYSITFDSRQKKELSTIKTLAALLAKQTHLKALGLRFGELNKTEVKLFTKALMHLQLTHLEMMNNSMSVAEIKALSIALPSMSELVYLDLSHNDIGAEGMEILSENLPDMTKLSYLDLNGNGIGADGTKSLASAILKRLKNIVHLGLKSNDLKNEGVKNLAVSLLQMRKLTHLDLGNNNITAEGALILAETLPKQVTHLDISDNDINLNSLSDLKETLKRRRCKIVKIIASLRNRAPKTHASISSSNRLSRSRQRQLNR